MRHNNEDLLRILVRAEHLAVGASPFLTEQQLSTLKGQVMAIAKLESKKNLLGYITVKTPAL